MTRLPGASSDLPGACEVYSCDNPETADSKNIQSKFRLIQLSAAQVRRAVVAPGINPHQHLFQSSRPRSLSALVQYTSGNDRNRRQLQRIRPKRSSDRARCAGNMYGESLLDGAG